MSKQKKINSNLPVHKIYKKFNSDLCDSDLSFHDCELEILRHAIDESEKIQGNKIVNSNEVQDMLDIVEKFIIRKKLLCYGGTAINNILPKFAQFYNRDIEIPDYDFYSANALDDAKELADIYYSNGYTDVEAKSGVHFGTFKVFVNFIPIADITYMNRALYNVLSNESIVVSGIHYVPPNFLRMSMYLELSRPLGDVSRWEKVFKRLYLLNKYYPMKPKENCRTIDFQRKMESNKNENEHIYIVTRDSFIEQGVIFFGGYAVSLYSKYMPEERKKSVQKIPDFDVLSEDPIKCATILKEKLMREGIKKIKIINHEAIGEIIPYHVEEKFGSESIAYIYTPIACHSYNKIVIENKEIYVATIDTILTFYLSFLYVNNKIYNKNRLLCMAKFLFDVEQENRLAQKGLLKRFSLDCYGKQLTLDDLRSEKAEKYKELSDNRESKEYEMWFLKYVPHAKANADKANAHKANAEKNNKANAENLDKKSDGALKKRKPKTEKKLSVLQKYLEDQQRKTRKNL